MADNRRYNKNINSALLEYHYIDNPTSTQKSEAHELTGTDRYVPIIEQINSSSYQYIKISGYHYKILNTSDPTDGSGWTVSNTFTTLYDTLGGGPIELYVDASASTPSYLKVGDNNNGFKYYQLVNDTCYYELCSKMPSFLKNGEIAVGRSENAERLYIKNSGGDMVEFRSYEANVEYVNNEINEVYNLIYSIHYVPGWSLNKSTIFKGTNNSMVATASLKFNGVNETIFNATTPSGWTVGTTSGTTRTFTKTLNTSENTTTVSTTISKDIYSKNMSATITAVNHIYYGKSSATNTKVLTGLSSFNTATTTPNGREYEVTMSSGDYFYIAVPSSVTGTPSQVGTGGSSGFFETLATVGTAELEDSLTGVTETYTFYRTQSGQAQGTFKYYVK